MSRSDAAPVETSARSLWLSSFPAFALVYAALFGAFGTESPFLPAFFGDRGLSSGEIGVVLSAGTVVRLLAGPLLGNAADRFGAKRVLALMAGCAGLIGMAYLAAEGFRALLVVCVLHSLVVTPLAAVADALALAASAKERVFDYGWVRGIGSAAFIAGTLVSGTLVAAYGTASIIVASSILFASMVLPIWRIPPNEGPAAGEDAGGIRALLTMPAFRRAVVVGGLIIGSHAMSETFAVISWRAAGIGGSVIGLLWSEAVLSEVFVFFVVGPVALARMGPGWCAALGAGAGIIRWSVLATTSSVGVLAATQWLHGFTFALVHLACLQTITEVCPPRLSSTAQSIYGTFALGLASAVFTALSGFLYEREANHAFWLMAAVCLCAIPLALSLRHTPRSRLSPPHTA